MNEKLISDNIEDDEFNLNIEDKDYKNLVIRLQDISANIALLEKKYLENL